MGDHGGGSGGYSFAANPRPVAGQRSGYREPEKDAPRNLMFDPRVRRGNTYGATVSLATQTAGGQRGTATAGVEAEGAGNTMTRTVRRRAPVKKSIFDLRPGAKEREEIDLDIYLIEQKEDVGESAVETQTEAFLDRPATPPYVPTKTGIDAFTQIEEKDGLFDFDVEVEPILDVIVGKTLEQSLLELEQEQELTSLWSAKTRLHADRRADDDRIKGMEKDQRKHYEEKRRIVARERERLAREQQAAAKVAAVEVGQSFAASAVANALEFCESAGFFKDPVREAVENDFLPGIYKRVLARLDGTRTAQACTDALITSALARQLELHEERIKADEAERKRLAEAERKKYMRVFVKLTLPDGPTTQVGPVVVKRTDTIGEAETKIRQWLKDNPSKDTAPLLEQSSKELRLCVDTKPVEPNQPLLEAVKNGGALELLAIGGEDDESEGGDD